MFNPSRRRLCLAALIAAHIAASSTQAREAAPWIPAPRARLAVVEAGQAFSIRTDPTTTGSTARADAPVDSKLALGLNLKLDRSLFSAVGRSSMEASDAPRR